MTVYRRSPQWALWSVALVLALGGGAWFLIASTKIAWWLGSAAMVPLVLLVIARGNRLEREGRLERRGGGDVDGLWGPPDV